MDKRICVSGLQIARPLYELVTQDILPGIENLDSNQLWTDFAEIVSSLAAENNLLLQRREELQQQLNTWYAGQDDDFLDIETAKKYLFEIGYLLPEGDDFQIITENVDPEIAHIAGPQLVVPVNNARYALNAANARWGSLYDALYGTDVIPEKAGLEKTEGFNQARGCAVITWGFEFLDQAVALRNGSHKDVTRYTIKPSDSKKNKLLEMTLKDGQITCLNEPDNAENRYYG
jgi:malate synthase